jgi:hypothetical protein
MFVITYDGSLINHKIEVYMKTLGKWPSDQLFVTKYLKPILFKKVSPFTHNICLRDHNFFLSFKAVAFAVRLDRIEVFVQGF